MQRLIITNMSEEWQIGKQGKYSRCGGLKLVVRGFTSSQYPSWDRFYCRNCANEICKCDTWSEQTTYSAYEKHLLKENTLEEMTK